ncbi:CheR family methyltransferase [Deefgea sp. CFH1-16]|uniref:CheR family methyltransferase n=1 Tax=Deefgea sp. CFH1-16 TaxID=2675457 RepID=UPI0027DD9C32|nr:CheR family methyltransferase [Deefgea sp. CFH1-16]
MATWPKNHSLNVWSAASSTGEEIWSIAMILAHQLGEQADWHVLGSDISLRVIAQAKTAHYSLTRADGIPSTLMRKYCLKGVGKQEGSLLIASVLRNKVGFRQINLAVPLPEIGLFDFIFLRNVLIYFDSNGKQDILSRVVKKLKSNAYLLVSHSESLYGLSNDLKLVKPGIYQYKSIVDV